MIVARKPPTVLPAANGSALARPATSHPELVFRAWPTTVPGKDPSFVITVNEPVIEFRPSRAGPTCSSRSALVTFAECSPDEIVTGAPSGPDTDQLAPSAPEPGDVSCSMGPDSDTCLPALRSHTVVGVTCPDT